MARSIFQITLIINGADQKCCMKDTAIKISAKNPPGPRLGVHRPTSASPPSVSNTLLLMSCEAMGSFKHAGDSVSWHGFH